VGGHHYQNWARVFARSCAAICAETGLSENDAVMSVYPDIFWTPYDDESPQDKATREEEEKEEAELEEAEEAM